MRHPILKSLTLAAAACVLAGAAARADEVEVLHWWTSGGEARSVGVLKQIMQGKGHTWRDFAVVGGGGDNASALLRSRVQSGNPPAAAQIMGPAIQEWAAQGVLANLDPIAQAEGWDGLLPKVVADLMKYQGHYVAVPVNVHRVNWLWANAEVLRQAGVASMPVGWEAFFAAADKVRQAGFIPLAMGGSSWNHAIAFESVALGVGGARFYADAFVRRDPRALNSEAMKNVLETYRRLKAYTDPGAAGRDWNTASALLIQGKAGFQFMGDWAKGEFLAAGKLPSKDFLCAAAPGNANTYSYAIDSFIAFRLQGAGAKKAQSDLAAAIMGAEFQQVFNLNKGSIPVRLGLDMDRFDACAKISSKEFVHTARTGGLVPSVSQGMALKPAIDSAVKEVLSRYWNDDTLSATEAMQQLAAAAQ